MYQSIELSNILEDLHDSSKMLITIVGLGGVGSWLVEPVIRATISNGSKPNVLLIDGDVYESSNANRQICHPKLVGMNKAEATAIRMMSYFPDLKIVPLNEYLCDRNVRQISRIVTKAQISFICVDNNFARQIASLYMSGFVLFPGNEYIDGNCFINMPSRDHTITEAHPEVMDDETGDRSEMSCEEISNLDGGEQIITTNFMAAAHALQAYYHVLNNLKEGTPVNVRETYFDIKQCTSSAVLTDGGRR